MSDHSSTDQLTYDEADLLASHDYAAPLVAGGRTCHGGFDSAGDYLSPRTLNRRPAIDAWQQHHRDTFGTDIFDIALEEFPEHFPNVEQAKVLLRRGAPEPIIATLTRIGTVEGFGSFLRYSIVPDLQHHFDEDIAGTATAHLDRGLIEAHARDEAGFGDEAGHNLMWFAARDIAFEDPVTTDQTAIMLERMGIAAPGGGGIDLARLRKMAMENRRLPDDIDFDVESLIERMARLLLIEVSAFHAFRWAEAVLSDTELVAGDGEAARIVSYIRADETPHVDYIRTVLTEMRDRTFVGSSGRRHAGSDVIEAILEPAVVDQKGVRANEVRDLIWSEINRAVEGRGDAADLLEEIESVGSIRRLEDGSWVPTRAAA
jgi:hypothetical protein